MLKFQVLRFQVLGSWDLGAGYERTHGESAYGMVDAWTVASYDD